MTIRKLVVAGLGLAVCTGWALRSSLAVPAPASKFSYQSPNPAAIDPSIDREARAVPPQPSLARATEASFEDPAYLAAFHVAPLSALIPDESEKTARPVEVLRADSGDPRLQFRIVENPVWASEEDRMHTLPASERSGPPCVDVAYQNRPGPFIGIVGGWGSATNPLIGYADDLTLPVGVTNPFICSVTVSTTGNRSGGPDYYDVQMSLWDQCPDEPGAIMVGSGSFSGIPNDSLFRAQTIQIDPHFRDPTDTTLWVNMHSGNQDAFIIYGQNTVQAGDIGETQDSFCLVDGTAPGAIVGFPDPTAFYDGFDCTLRGTAGPLGSCCDTNGGVCAINKLYAECNALTQSWSEINDCGLITCNACPVSTCSPGSALENEPDPSANYVDTTNAGCLGQNANFLTPYFTPVLCNTSGCGRSGNYTFQNGSITENRRDEDYYVLTLTRGDGDKLVTFSVTGTYPTQAVIGFTVRQTNTVAGLRCHLQVSTAATDTPVATANTCQTATATAVLAAPSPNSYYAPGPVSQEANGFRYVLRARPNILTGIAPGASYNWSVQCAAPPTPLATGACCTPGGCIETSALGCLVGGNVYQGDGVSCGSVSCPGVPANDTCPNRVLLTGDGTTGQVKFDTGWVVDFDNTFADTDGLVAGSCQTIFKDVWYRYVVPTNKPFATSGRLIGSTIGSCFNSKIVMYRINNVGGPAANQCATHSQLACSTPFIKNNDQIPLNVSKFAYAAAPVASAGQQWHFRVGGNTQEDFGRGQLRIDWVPGNSPNFDSSSGRCCFLSGHCISAPRQTQGPNLDNCQELGGYMRNTTDFYEGFVSGTISEVASVGCNTVPCPVAGEACFNALDLNAILGGGFGSHTRLAINKMYFKYTVPSLPVGSALTIESCGATNYDTAIALYRNLDVISGECIEQTPINNYFADNDDCSPTHLTASGAQGIADCYRIFQFRSCKCLTIVASGPGLNQVRSGDTIYIGVGGSPTFPLASPRKIIDPDMTTTLASELTCPNPAGSTFPLGPPGVMSIGIKSSPACFTCSVACPGGATPEGEPNCSQNYVDNTDAGCSAPSPSQQNFKTIACGQTYCGTSGTYKTDRPCLSDTDCLFDETCNGSPIGICQKVDDDTRDNDWYRITVAAPTRLTWAVTAFFPAALQIVAAPNNDCLDVTTVAQQTNSVQCDTTTIAADVCAGTYYLLVQPTNETGQPCSGIYYATLTCGSPSVSTATICKGDMNNDGVVNSKDIRLWMNELLFPATSVFPASGCFSLGTLRGDFNADFAVSIGGDLSLFVSELLLTPTCAPTTMGNVNGCQVPTGDDTGVISDMSNTLVGGRYRCADDFKVTNTSAATISEVDWWGFYVDYTTVSACSPIAGNGDNFKITIYNDTVADVTLQKHIPGTVLTGPHSVTVLPGDKVADGTVLFLGSTFQRYRYKATIPNTVVAAGGTYWIEIVNDSTGCLWHWSTSRTGNTIVMQKSTSASVPAGTPDWTTFDQLPAPPDPANQLDDVPSADLAFCLPSLRLDSEASGQPKGRCCLYPSFSCSVQKQLDCELALGGVWGVAVACTSGCPVLPANDDCANATVITRNPLYSGSTLNATRDGPAMSCESNCAPICNSARDIWFQWRATFDGSPIFTTCDTDDPLFRFDQMMVVYNACPGVGGTALLGGCNDDACGGSGPSRVVGATVTTGNTYWIRCSGWKGSKGNLKVRVVKPGDFSNDP